MSTSPSDTIDDGSHEAPAEAGFFARMLTSVGQPIVELYGIGKGIMGQTVPTQVIRRALNPK